MGRRARGRPRRIHPALRLERRRQSLWRRRRSDLRGRHGRPARRRGSARRDGGTTIMAEAIRIAATYDVTDHFPDVVTVEAFGKTLAGALRDAHARASIRAEAQYGEKTQVTLSHYSQ